MSAPRVVVVAKRSQYGRYVEDEDDPRIRQLIAHRDRSVGHWLAAHEEHARTLEAVREGLTRFGAQVLQVNHPSAQFDPTDAVCVVTVGGDGTLLAASHNVKAIPILGVNSAPRFSVGSFCGARRSNLTRAIGAALQGKGKSVRLTRMQVLINGSTRSRRILNEVLFSHSSPAATSRYIIHLGRAREEQRSSGFWIGPAAGSTAAQRSAGGQVLPLESSELQLVVREPYTPRGQHYRLRRAVVAPPQQLTVRSMIQHAALFLDGPYRRLRVHLGDTITFRASDEPLRLLGLGSRRTKR